MSDKTDGRTLQQFIETHRENAVCCYSKIILYFFWAEQSLRRSVYNASIILISLYFWLGDDRYPTAKELGLTTSVCLFLSVLLGFISTRKSSSTKKISTVVGYLSTDLLEIFLISNFIPSRIHALIYPAAITMNPVWESPSYFIGWTFSGLLATAIIGQYIYLCAKKNPVDSGHSLRSKPLRRLSICRRKSHQLCCPDREGAGRSAPIQDQT